MRFDSGISVRYVDRYDTSIVGCLDAFSLDPVDSQSQFHLAAAEPLDG